MKRSIEYLVLFCAAIAATLASFTATAFAAGQVEPDDGSLFDVLRPIYAAFHSGQYVYAGSLALVLSCALVKRYGGDRWPALHGDVGGSLLALATAFGASLTATLAGGAQPTWAMAWNALTIAAGAAGGYALVKKLLVVPLLLPLAAKYPKLGALLSPLLWIFGSGSNGAVQGS